MTDRKLLEYAAKAIGRCLHKNTRDSHGNWGTDTYCTDCGKSTYGERWDPLTDDGDALRLAVKLRLDVIHMEGESLGHVVRVMGSMNIDRNYEVEGDDPYSATRRAIVRAAAEIGKAMQ